ncbi:MAG: hypothetical protein ABFD54_07920 [Armatimonadota bacterium]
MRYFILTIVLLAVAAFWHLIVFRMSPRLGLVKLNFNKTPIMASYGIVSFAYIAAIAGGLKLAGRIDVEHMVLYIAVMAAMWVLGIMDDVWGTREVGGFKGHFKKLILERKLTTGAVKALGGGVVGIIGGWWLSGGDPARWITAALLIPLASNILNLFDLRPGRAVAVFFLGIGVTWLQVGGSMSAPLLVGTISAVTLIFSIVDSRGKAMMGDSGSNMLGAALGITMALNTNVVSQVIAIVVILAIHLYSEKHSVSALIDRNPVLRFIDRRLGVR